MKGLEDFPEDQLRLYAEFGIAAEKAQVLEFEAGNVALSFVALFVGTDRIGPEESAMFRSLVDDVNRQTLGALLRSIRRMANFENSLLTIVDEALERRNYLAHRFFPSHNYALFDKAGRQKMIDELRAIQTTLDRAHRALSAISSLLDKMAGHPELSAATAQELIARGRKLNL